MIGTLFIWALLAVPFVVGTGGYKYPQFLEHWTAWLAMAGFFVAGYAYTMRYNPEGAARLSGQFSWVYSAYHAIPHWVWVGAAIIAATFANIFFWVWLDLRRLRKTPQWKLYQRIKKLLADPASPYFAHLPPEQAKMLWEEVDLNPESNAEYACSLIPGLLEDAKVEEFGCSRDWKRPRKPLSM